jgi:hypothetical protein
MISLDNLVKEKIFKEKYDLNKKNEIEQITFILENLLKLKEKDDTTFEFLLYLNHIICNSENEIFDEISMKYLTTLNDIYKNYMNRENYNLISIKVIEQVNYNFLSYFKNFTKNFQNYNEYHKNIIKNLPGILKIYFNLLSDKFEIHNELREIYSLIDSFMINIIGLINYFPNMIRSFEIKIEKIIKNLFNVVIYTEIDKKFIKTLTLAYTMLIRLSTNPNLKLKNYINNLIKNIEGYNNIFRPKTMKDSISRDIINENNLFFENLKTMNIIVANNISYILIKLIKNSIRITQKSYEIDILSLLSIAKIDDKEIVIKDYIVEGLNLEDYKIYIQYSNLFVIKYIKFLVLEYHDYIYFYLPNIKNELNKIILKEPVTVEIYFQILKLFKITIKYFDALMVSIIFDIVYKYSYNNFIDILITYLERNDKTIIKVDQKYFKVGNIKSKKNQKSLLQIAMNDAYNQKLEKLSNFDIHNFLLLYLESIL